jgi:hypothetical protein
MPDEEIKTLCGGRAWRILEADGATVQLGTELWFSVANSCSASSRPEPHGQ